MKTVLALLLTGTLSFILGEYLPWWSVGIAAFAVSLFFNQNPVSAFLSGFLGIAILWIAYAAWIDTANESILSSRVAALLPLQGNPILLLLFTGFIGGAVGGLSALSANFIVRSKKGRYDNQNYYRRKLR